MTTPTQGEHAQTEALRPKFGDLLRNTMASESNPRRDAYFIREVHRSGGGVNPGRWFEMTDGKGETWLSNPQNMVSAAPAQPAAPQGVAEVNWWEADGDKYDASISPMQPAQGVAYAELPESLMLEVDRWFADNTGLGGCSGKDVRELAQLFYEVAHEGGRESVDDALAIVESFGPGISGLNDTYARQVLLAEEVKRLRASHGQAPAGASRFADVIAVQRSEAEADPSDAYMVGLYNGMSMMDANYRNITDWGPMGTAPKPSPTAPALHPKTADLVQRFSAALAEKLSAAEKKYGYRDGWASPDWVDECRLQLREHLFKGDPRDVAAYCAFLWHHGASTALPAEVVEELAAEVTRLFPAPAPTAQAAPAAGAVAGPSLQEIQWRNIRKVVDALADFCFGSQDDPRWGVAHVAIRTSLTAKDGLDVQALKLEPLAAPTPAAQADSVLEDAARWQALPAFYEEYQIDAMKLYRDIDAYLDAARKQGAKHDNH